MNVRDEDGALLGCVEAHQTPGCRGFRYFRQIRCPDISAVLAGAAVAVTDTPIRVLDFATWVGEDGGREFCVLCSAEEAKELPGFVPA